ncbi:MAG: hypothetical protein R3F53_05715 [Gammaproteobacteria bacterium]
MDEPYQQAQPGLRPPLIKGMFTEVELRGRARGQSGGAAVRHCMTAGFMWSMPRKQRLRQRTYGWRLCTGDLRGRDGCEGGCQSVVSRSAVAIDGMLLEPVPDPAAQARLQQAVSGTQP